MGRVSKESERSSKKVSSMSIITPVAEIYKECNDSSNYCFSCCSNKKCIVRTECQLKWKKVSKYSWNVMLIMIGAKILPLMFLIWCVFRSLKKREDLIDINLALKQYYSFWGSLFSNKFRDIKDEIGTILDDFKSEYHFENPNFGSHIVQKVY